MALVDDLRKWGIAQTARSERHDRDEHVLSRAQDFAPGTRKRAALKLIGRGGLGRRTLMGAAAGRFTRDGKPIPVPMWSCDPVPPRGATGGGSDVPISIGHSAWVDPMPDELRWISAAIAAIERKSVLRAMVVREEFMGTGTQRMKAARVQAQYGGRLTYDMYRKELRMGIEFLELMQMLDRAA